MERPIFPGKAGKRIRLTGHLTCRYMLRQDGGGFSNRYGNPLLMLEDSFQIEALRPVGNPDCSCELASPVMPRSFAGSPAPCAGFVMPLVVVSQYVSTIFPDGETSTPTSPPTKLPVSAVIAPVE